MRELVGQKIGWERKALVFFAALVFLSVLGPFGTYDTLGLWERIAFWTIILTGIGFFMHVLITVALGTQLLGSANQFARIAIGAVLAGLPGAVVVIFTDMIFRDSSMGAGQLPMLWLQVALIGLVIGLTEFADWRRQPVMHQTPPRTALHDRLPPDAGAIVSLSMQDHYVEVTAEHAKELLLMRLSDAIAELKELEGVQVHRSHWVARDAIAAVERSGRKTRVRLTDGRSLPVSATYADALGAAAPAHS